MKVSPVPRVSVLIATKNYARWLGRAIDSVLSQTFRDFELIIVDDGSTDATPDIVGAAADGDERIRSFRTRGCGASAARNIGLDACRGELIAFLDGDDVWLPTKLEKQVALLDTAPQIGMCYTRRMWVDGEEQPIPRKEPPLVRGMALAEVLLRNPICFSSAVVRRIVIEHIGQFNEKLELAIDYDLWLRVARHYEIDYIDEVLVKYRTGHANLSRRSMDRLESVMSTMRRFLDRNDGSRDLSPRVLREARTSTMRSMAWQMRRLDPLLSLSWNVRAAWLDRRPLALLRSLAAYCWYHQLNRMIPAYWQDHEHSENAPVNR